MSFILDKEYIEKIIQLPIYIPELSAKDIQNYLLLLVAQSYLKQESFSRLIAKIFEEKMIVSGDIIKDETVKGQVVAKGVVYAETWYNVKVEYPLYYEEVRYLDEMKNNYILDFLNKSFSLKKNYTSSYLEKKKTLIKDKIFPFEISMEKQRKTKVIKQILTSDEAIKKAQEVAEKKIESFLDSDEYIISKKTLNFTSNDSKIIVDVFFKVYENITDYRQTDPSLLMKQGNEE